MSTRRSRRDFMCGFGKISPRGLTDRSPYATLAKLASDTNLYKFLQVFCEHKT